jgi:intracellular septation protein
MTQLLEWSPLLAFFVVFKVFGLYWATGVLMAACVALLLIHRARTGTFKTMHIITVVAVLVLGTATLLLHDKRFIQWKPTVLLGAAAIAFLGSSLVGPKPLARRMLEGVFSEPIEVTTHAWVVINSLWAAWFALLAALNLYIAHSFSEATWVNFKVFGITIAMIAFMIPQVLWLNGKIKPPPPVRASP